MQLSLSVRHSITDNALELELTGVFFVIKETKKGWIFLRTIILDTRELSDDGKCDQFFRNGSWGRQFWGDSHKNCNLHARSRCVFNRKHSGTCGFKEGLSQTSKDRQQLFYSEHVHGRRLVCCAEFAARVQQFCHGRSLGSSGKLGHHFMQDRHVLFSNFYGYKQSYHPRNCPSSVFGCLYTLQKNCDSQSLLFHNFLNVVYFNRLCLTHDVLRHVEWIDRSSNTMHGFGRRSS